jgi:hypothetical protein
MHVLRCMSQQLPIASWLVRDRHGRRGGIRLPPVRSVIHPPGDVVGFARTACLTLGSAKCDDAIS